MKTTITKTLCVVALPLILAGAAHAQTQFVPGDLAVLQVGDGSAAIGSHGNPIIVADYQTNGTFVSQVNIPTNGDDALVQGGSAFSGMLSLSTDGQYLVLQGYNTNIPYTLTSSIDTSTSIAVPRGVGTVDAFGNFILDVITTNKFSGGTIRGAVTDGQGNFWAGGSKDGIQYLGTNFSPGTISGAGAGAIRDMLMVNGSIYFSTSQYPATGSNGLAAFIGAPTNAATPTLVINASTNLIPGATGTPNPKGFAINPALTIAYYVDMQGIGTGGGIERFTGDGSGTNWVYQYTLTYTTDPFQELAVDFSGTNPVVYAIAATGSPNLLVSVVDTGAASTFNFLTFSPTSTVFRGLTFAPIHQAAKAPPATLSIVRSGTNVIVTWTSTGVLQSTTQFGTGFTDVPAAPVSPYTTGITGTNQFFRVR
ncbi:MAG TPA: hypothetical protein VFC44_10335 [Candidatus Saccharimonadales bacterium]|nr:hypothetical protein [Candidatus Saccharimonadales bacterium]